MNTLLADTIGERWVDSAKNSSFEQEYLIIDRNNDEVSYRVIESVDIVTGVKTVSLHYSKAECWLEEYRGKLIMSVKDDGDGVIFNKKIKKHIEYDELEYISILIGFIKETINSLVIEVSD